MTTLREVAEKYGADKAEHGYCPHYQEHLPNQEDAFTLFEIGIAKGCSMRMWHEWFPNARIIGMDNNPDVKDIPNEGFEAWFGDGTVFDERLTDVYPEVIIDDGSHHSDDIIKTFEAYWPQLAIGGWYVIEDLATQFDPHWGGSETGSPATLIIGQLMKLTYLAQGIEEFHAYQEIAFIKKGGEA